MFWREVMFWRVAAVFVAISFAAESLAAGKVRTWTSADGRTMQAEFVRELDGDATFLKDGKLIVIRVEKLSEKDQQLVKELAAGKEPVEPQEDPFSPSPVERSTSSAEKPRKAIPIQTRTWTDRSGETSSGKFVRVDGNDVVLSRGVRVITVPFANLCEADQEYVREILTSQGKEADIPSENPRVGRESAGGPISGGGNSFPPAGRGRNPVRDRNSGPGMTPGAPGGISGFPPEGMGRGGPGAGIGMPPGGRPPTSGLGGAGGGSMMGPEGMTEGLEGMETGFPDTDPIGGSFGPTGGMAGPGRMPEPGMIPGMMPAQTGLGGPGMDPYPRSPMRSMEPPILPTISNPAIPSTQVEVYMCSKCQANLTKLEAMGSVCPRCNTVWGFKQDAFGNKTVTAGGSGRFATVGVVVIFVLLGMVVFITLFIVITVAIVKAGMSPTPQQQPQRYS
jgi:SLA1 homology domain 1, SHD1